MKMKKHCKVFAVAKSCQY